MMILQLPEHITQQILSYLSYQELSEARRVCQFFNHVCQDLLSQGFNKVDTYHNKIQKHVKSQLPRRESERRNHELSRHVDILSAMETRLSLLSMTFTKYIDYGLCCFIPGKVLDEMFTLLHKLHASQAQPPRAHEFLQELRDISSMAMEHFEEHIVPGLKLRIPSGSIAISIRDQYSMEPATMSNTPYRPSMSDFRQELVRMCLQLRVHGGCLQKYKHEMTEQKRKLIEQERKNLEQSRIILDQNARISRLENAINDLNNKVFSNYSVVDYAESTSDQRTKDGDDTETENKATKRKMSHDKYAKGKKKKIDD